jgi:spore germination protein GerM
LTSLDFIDSILFFAGDYELLRQDGTALGGLTRDFILIEPNENPINTVRKNILLYFSDENAQSLIHETREININPILISEGIEPYYSTLNELISGPLFLDRFRTIPENIRFNRVERNGNILTIDFFFLFLNIRLGSTGEFLMFASIANTFTEFEEILGVQILIDGVHIQDLHHSFHMNFLAPLERDESIINR